MLNSRKQPSTSTSSPNLNATRERLEHVLAPMPDAASAPAPEPKARPTQADEGHRKYRVRRGRFRRTVAFFVLLFVRVIAWEVFIRRFTSEAFVARGRSARWRWYARRFRTLAVEMGGVMIKLGQFVSTRVDVLPPEITEELAGLQDQVPLVDFGYIKSTVERELGPIESRFLWFNAEPVAAASFGQVHRAQLQNGDRVVVKVQRPQISDIVQTDLRALRLVARLAMSLQPVRRRANVPALLEEFSRVLWEELDYIQEADNAMTFNSMFANDLGIYVPGVYLQHTTHQVLTLEDVTSIKINDYTAIDQAGVDRKEVAKRLLNCYMRQIFDLHFFHADPHPGNLFVYPLPEDAKKNGKAKSRNFYLIFIDFGMTGRLTKQLAQGLRDTLVAVVTQDAKALVRSYGQLGILMPDADTERLEQATRAVFDKVWGLNMNQITNLPFDEVTDVALEFSDLIMSMPFQMPQDFIYLSRTVSILSGMCTGLDPEFDPWHEMQPFAERLLREGTSNTLWARISGGAPGLIVQSAFKSIIGFAQRASRLPALADTVLERAHRGELVVQVKPDEELQRRVTRIESALNQLSVGVVFGTVALASTLLYIGGERGLGVAGYAVSGLLFFMLLLRGRG